MNKLDLIVDLQYGSTGKGLIAGYLAEKHGYDCVVNANMPNAGHTYIDDKGQKMVHKVLPNGIVSPSCDTVLIGPGSVLIRLYPYPTTIQRASSVKSGFSLRGKSWRQKFW